MKTGKRTIELKILEANNKPRHVGVYLYQYLLLKLMHLPNCTNMSYEAILKS